MEFDALFLSRLQFALTLGFHILFPTLTLGLAPFLVVLEALWLRTGKDIYVRLFRFWAKLFGLAFGMGVVTGVVLSFEFGTNFAPFSHATGNVLGPLLAYEVLMAFFLEAGFLPVMLLGWGRVGVRLHLFATCMVALGTVLSAFWILAANSWMHTPAGFTLEDGVFSPADWWQVVFNPSFPYRLAHVPTVFFAFRIMVGIGFFLFAVAVAGLVLRWRGALYARPWFLRLCVACSPLGLVAVVAGWVATEVGRQPWVVQGLMTTTEAATPLAASTVAFSLALYLLLYAVLLPVFLFFFGRMVVHGPEQALPEQVQATRRSVWYRARH